MAADRKPEREGEHRRFGAAAIGVVDYQRHGRVAAAGGRNGVARQPCSSDRPQGAAAAPPALDRRQQTLRGRDLPAAVTPIACTVRPNVLESLADTTGSRSRRPGFDSKRCAANRRTMRVRRLPTAAAGKTIQAKSMVSWIPTPERRVSHTNRPTTPSWVGAAASSAVTAMSRHV